MTFKKKKIFPLFSVHKNKCFNECLNYIDIVNVLCASKAVDILLWRYLGWSSPILTCLCAALNVTYLFFTFNSFPTEKTSLVSPYSIAIRIASILPTFFHPATALIFTARICRATYTRMNPPHLLCIPLVRRKFYFDKFFPRTAAL